MSHAGCWTGASTDEHSFLPRIPTEFVADNPPATNARWDNPAVDRDKQSDAGKMHACWME